MKKKIMNVCGVALLAVSLLACSGQKKGAEAAESVSDTVKVATEAMSAQADSTGYIVRIGEMAPDFTITLTDGKQVTLSSLRGKVVMLQFTASWCGVCRKEMPFIEKDIWLKHKDNADFALIGIDRDEPLEKVLAFAKSTGVTYPLGLDPGADIFTKYALRDAGITRNVLIDREGKIVKLTRLYNEEEFASLVQQINEMLK
ncbi:TlpA family protein disulfide reductase [Bacteroides thetaiotaomicron]|uniref:TlpA family protein disulfide reductase n=1 Tax=Bacteroides thetaiotaomicron TaxID=818 RepID=UPI00202FD3A1|nr:TlpA disulfide reductase family protein [Bacteroides thetaiotaomicron]MCM1654342.1 TlpA family protein disulfide reductase [Bacteroides thetaiotaomicron]MCM1659799.1 TlpA family protein disulfide reductase [Bacteroides thetaiotaomicron]MCM1695968.1 TlpA family protein disulfide reductase [Bacteroides thetaiotaomicron]MCM1708686.1 TlpA family protein disulfide reductase [Bacteroides thetaiotaomicron]MCM1791343.1 TlpA family protein disulfide reductase [Bacteroides thetaiotaomicron]